MAAPNNLQVSFSPLTLAHAATAPIDGTVLHVSGDSSTNNSPIDNPAAVFIHVTAPPSAGTITVNGVPGSDFTLAQAQAGLVLYHNNITTSAASDSFSVWARCNDGSTALPLTPLFVTTSEPYGVGSEQVGMYFGCMLVGATDANIYNAHFKSTSHGEAVPFTVTTTVPNSVLLLGFASFGGNAGTGVPPTYPITSISFAGLSFTRLSQQTQLVPQPGFPSMLNLVMEVWWALAPVPVSGPLTVTTHEPFFPEGSIIAVDVTVFSGLANPSAPFDTNASNPQQFISTAPPWTGMAMTPNAPDYRVVPWVYELVAGDKNAVSPMTTPPGAMPRGYGITNEAGDHTNNTYEWHSAGRVPTYATASISFTGPIPPATLGLDNLLITAAVKHKGQLVFLDWSDDRGHSFGSPVGQPIGATGAYLTNVQWQRCGYGRDRVFRLTWSAPVATALQGAFIEVDTNAKS